MQEFRIKVLVEGKLDSFLKIRNDFSKVNKVEIVEQINRQLGNHYGLKLFIQDSSEVNPYYFGHIPSNGAFHVVQQEIISKKYIIRLQKDFEIQKNSKMTFRTIKEVRIILGEFEGYNSQFQIGTKVETFIQLCEQISEKISTVRQYDKEFQFGKIFYYDFDYHEDSQIGSLYGYNKSIKEFIKKYIQNGFIQNASIKHILAALQSSLQGTHYNCCMNSNILDLSKLDNLQEEIDRLVKKRNKNTNAQIASSDISFQNQQIQELNRDFEQLKVQNSASYVQQYQQSVDNNMSTDLNIDQMSYPQDVEIEKENAEDYEWNTENYLDENFNFSFSTEN